MVCLSACSTTKHVPDGDQLFTGLTKIEYKNYVDDDNFIATQEEVEAALATAPNGALFGSSYYRTPFPYGLWIWNYAYGSSGKIKKWLNKSFGKAPVLMSQVNPALRASVAQSVLRKNGYMHGQVTYEEKPQRNPKKMKIGYTVTLDTLFTIATLSYVNFPPQMQALIDSTQQEAQARKGDPFNVATLDAERSRLSQLFRNNGYYYYQSGYASYLADTFDVRNRAKLRLQLADSLPEQALHPWYVGNIRMQLRESSRQQMTDSIGRRFLKIFYGTGKKHAPISPRVILRDLKLRPRRLFSYADYSESIQKINGTGVFSSVDLQFTPRDRDTLDLTLNCTFDKPWDVYLETNFVNRTIGRMGPELKLGFTRRNAFRGGEKLDVNLHGSYEWQTSSQESNMNTYQYGADASLEFPRILLPFVSDSPRRDKDGRVMVDLNIPSEYRYELVDVDVRKVSDTRIEGISHQLSARPHVWSNDADQEYTVHFVMEFNAPILRTGVWNEAKTEWSDKLEAHHIKDGGMFVEFDTRKHPEVMVRTGISLVGRRFPTVSVGISMQSLTTRKLYGTIFSTVSRFRRMTGWRRSVSTPICSAPCAGTPGAMSTAIGLLLTKPSVIWTIKTMWRWAATLSGIRSGTSTSSGTLSLRSGVPAGSIRSLPCMTPAAGWGRGLPEWNISP